MSGAVERGRSAFARRAWADAYAELSAADAAEPLVGAELERLAQAAALVGKDGESVDVWARACRGWERAGDPARAVRAAFWLAFGLLNNGQMTLGGGWIDKARRLLDDAGTDCVERGHLRYLGGLRATLSGDASAGAVAFIDLNLAFRNRYKSLDTPEATREADALGRHRQPRASTGRGSASRVLPPRLGHTTAVRAAADASASRGRKMRPSAASTSSAGLAPIRERTDRQS